MPWSSDSLPKKHNLSIDMILKIVMDGEDGGKGVVCHVTVSVNAWFGCGYLLSMTTVALVYTQCKSTHEQNVVILPYMNPIH